MSASSSSSSLWPTFDPGQSPNYSFTRPRAPSPYLRTLLAYIDAVNAFDFSAVNDVFDDALEHRILPKSLERPVLTKRQYGAYFKGIMSLFSTFETKIHEVIEAEDKMTVHGSTKGESLSGTPYINDYVLIIHFAPLQGDGELPKIRYLKEFVDSSLNMNFFREEKEKQRRRRAEEAQWK